MIGYQPQSARFKINLELLRLSGNTTAPRSSFGLFRQSTTKMSDTSSHERSRQLEPFASRREKAVPLPFGNAKHSSRVGWEDEWWGQAKKSKQSGCYAWSSMEHGRVQSRRGIWKLAAQLASVVNAGIYLYYNLLA